jgi:outer membrane receptor for ferric coprogen and ferric-rhodotorulic acid
VARQARWQDRQQCRRLLCGGHFGLFGREHELVVGGSASRKRWTNTGYGLQAGFPDTVPDYRSWNGDIAEPQWQRTYDNNEVTRENGCTWSAVSTWPIR